METIIGLEIHAQLKTKSKMFCACDNDSEEAASNTNTCPVCMGQPGTLPVVNEQAIRLGVLAGLALHCEIAEFSKFDRKNYFYPDLPKGYQISQYDRPLCIGGELKFAAAGTEKTVRLRRLHLEDDAGKLTHSATGGYSLVDYNRAGTPLAEIVTEPDLRSSAEAKYFLQEIQKILRSLRVSDADMEKGQLRCDANISVREKDRTTAIVEIKNLNSFRSVEKALLFEERRLRDLLQSGQEQTTIKETRGWNEKTGVTISQRSKEAAHDYRYFPEPDLPPLEIDRELVAEIKRSLPEMPRERAERFRREKNIKEADARLLAGDPTLSDFFENTVSELAAWIKSSGEQSDQDPDQIMPNLAQQVANWILSELLKYVKEDDISFADIKITPENMAEFINIVRRQEINSSAAQVVLGEMYRTGQDPSQIIDEKNLRQISDQCQMQTVVAAVIKDNPGPAQDYKSGKTNALQFLVGQVMKATQGKADPAQAIKYLKEKLK